MSSLTRKATPPPLPWGLCLFIQLYPGMLGAVFPSFVSARAIMWASLALAAVIRLGILPRIPCGFAYSRFIFFCFLLFLFFFFLFFVSFPCGVRAAGYFLLEGFKFGRVSC